MSGTKHFMMQHHIPDKLCDDGLWPRHMSLKVKHA